MAGGGIQEAPGVREEKRELAGCGREALGEPPQKLVSVSFTASNAKSDARRTNLDGHEE